MSSEGGSSTELDSGDLDDIPLNLAPNGGRYEHEEPPPTSRGPPMGFSRLGPGFQLKMPTPVPDDRGAVEPGADGLAAMRSEPAYLPETSRGRPVPGLGLGALALGTQGRSSSPYGPGPGTTSAEDPGPPRTRRGPPLKPPMLSLANPASASPVPSAAPTPALGFAHGPSGLQPRQQHYHHADGGTGGPPAASGGRYRAPVRVELISSAFILQNLYDVESEPGASSSGDGGARGGGAGAQGAQARVAARAAGSRNEGHNRGGGDGDEDGDDEADEVEEEDDESNGEEEVGAACGADADSEGQGPRLTAAAATSTSGRQILDRCCAQLGVDASELQLFELRPLEGCAVPAACSHIGVSIRGSTFSLSALEEMLARSKRDEQLATLLGNALRDSSLNAAEARANAERLAKQSEELAVLRERLRGLDADNQHLREQLHRNEEHRQLLGGTIRTIRKEFEDFRSRLVVDATTTATGPGGGTVAAAAAGGEQPRHHQQHQRQTQGQAQALNLQLHGLNLSGAGGGGGGAGGVGR